jgi:uncharacterized membrane protein YgcG
MKTKVAMMISIVGVLAAGSAAALVNTQVLDSNAATSPLAVNDAVQVQQTVATVTVPSTVATAVVTPETVVPATPPTAAVLPVTQATYAVGDSGTVTLDTTGDVLTIVGVTPAAGWTVTKSEPRDATNVEVKFQSGTIEVQFDANLQFGVVTPSVESNDRSLTDNSVTSNSVDDHGGGGGGDDSSGHGGGGDD